MRVIHLARKPLAGSLLGTVEKHDCGALNIDAIRLPVDDDDDIWAKNPHTLGGFGHAGADVYGNSAGAPAYDPSRGRWPANILLACQGGRPCSVSRDATRFFKVFEKKDA